MKVSLNLIKEFTKIDSPIDELVAKIGAQLGAVEEVIDLGKKYQGIVVAKIVLCVEHPNSDHLHLCKIDDGGVVKDMPRDEKGYVQVVCGAPNAREGLLVAWLPPGTIVPSTVDKDPLVLEAREIRGEVSNGMLASAHELAISDDHTGILEINPDDAKPGDDFARVYKLDDYIIDIENKMFTHRPDLFGQLGVAREIAGIEQKAFKGPDWYSERVGSLKSTEGIDDAYAVAVSHAPKYVPRYIATVYKDIVIKPSPLWLQSQLARVGIRPINNVVDITNYVMYLTAQPLHAFDYEKVKAASTFSVAVLDARLAKKGEKLTLLSGKEITLTEEDIVIATNEKPIALGGVMGGQETEIDNNTTSIIIECANFDMYSIRRTAMRHGLFTDAVTRFTKGQSPHQNDRVMVYTNKLLTEVVGAKEAYPYLDTNRLDELGPPATVQVTAEFVNARLGLQLSTEEMKQLLENVECTVALSGDELHVTAPFWRTDIEIPEDVVEEVGRLYGYDKLPLTLPKRDLTPAKKDPLLELKAKIRDTLSKAGANEVLTYSFVHGNLLDKVGQDRNQAFQLANALSPDLQYYRLSLTPSLLDKIHPNIKAGYDEFVLFEIGKAHAKGQFDKLEPAIPKEFNNLALVVAASDRRQTAGAPYFLAKRYLDGLAEALGVTLRYEVVHEAREYPPSKPYDHTRSSLVYIGGSTTPLGMVGEFRPEVLRALKLPVSSAGFEIGITLELQTDVGQGYRPLPRFPKVAQDICLKVAANMTYQELYNFILQKIDALKPEYTLTELAPIDIYQREDDRSHKQITLRLLIAHYERTMTDDEVNALLDQVALAAKEAFGAERI